ncbi:glycyl-radical enzyme activating protein [Chakrabartyella piscis]|uniref:glycyl-radical enzyme activating protein n=1 Tax=Chakrabartyella piscis TaxID=2918914 RepID=UPI002958C9D3|nr:glycyl-radical enzyme activating protein [Chakrabartyella piscis]
MGHIYISNIQRFSLDDGPGIRTTVFFKGCNLACLWCHNPECIPMAQILQWKGNLCVNCGRCEFVCPNGAHKIEDGVHVLNRQLCTHCGLCVAQCHHKALELIGTQWNADALVKEILKDKAYFESSGGGVTFSGGEPLLFADEVAILAKKCKEEGLHVAVDTAGNVPFTEYEKLLSVTDLFLYDIKGYTSHLHKKWTTVPNQRILHNIQTLDTLGVSYTIRVPIIPGCNATTEEQEAISTFLRSLEHIDLIQLLPYHAYGVGKYEEIGITSKMKNQNPPPEEVMESFLQQYLEKGLHAVIG